VLVAPVAVRMFDLESPPPQVRLAPSRLGEPYRSLLAIARLRGDPLGAAVLPVGREGSVSRGRLARELRRQLETELTGSLPRTRHRPDARLRPVSVVVTTCQEPQVLRRCLRSILESDYDDFEVIVVENRPGAPDTRRMLAEEFLEQSRVRYVEEHARGLASARNAGLAAADGDLVAFTDDDVVVDQCWIRRSAEAFDRGDDIACVTGLILPLELETEAQVLLEQFMTLGKGFSRQSYRLPEARSEHPLLPYTPGLIGSGANTVLRVDVAERLGGFDANLGTGTPAIGGEDLDLYIRLLQEGHTVAYEPSAIVWHAHPDGMANVRRQVYRYGVGLTATLTKTLIAGPNRRALVRAVPAGIRYMRDPTSRKNASKSAEYPRRLDWLERVGMLVGPTAYLASLVRPTPRRRLRPSDLTSADGRMLDTEQLLLPAGETVRLVEVRPGPVRPRRRYPIDRDRAQAPSADRAVLTALFVTSLAVYAAARTAQVPNLAVGAVLGVLFFGVGTAPLQLSRSVPVPTRVGVAGLVGLSTILLTGAVMVLAPLWYPEVAAIVLLVGAGAAHAIAFPSALADLRLSRARRPRSPPRLSARISPSLVCTVAGTSLWLGSAILTGDLVPAIGGFPAQIGPVWYVGVAFVLAAIALALGEKRERYAAIGVGSLILAFTLTPALVYGMPRAQSAGKHVEFVRLILSAHHLDAGDGIYFAYCAFFAAVAWICQLAGASDPIGLATFWPVVIGFLRLAGLCFLFSRVIEGWQRRWAAITLVVLIDAFGADYLSPQSVGYVMALGIFALVLGAGPAVDRRLAAALIVLAGVALAPTHQLSPYVIGGVLLVLGAFRCAHPRWAGLAILAPAGAWALLNWGVLSGFFALSSLGRLSNFAPPDTTALPGLGRDPIVAASSRAMTLGMVLLTGAALVSLVRHRRERRAWAYTMSAGVGLMFVAINPYGNEGIFRASLFGIPWLALVAAHAVRRPDPILGQVAWLAVSFALFANFLVAAFGMDATAVMRRGDLGALRVFERTAPRNAYLLKIGFGDLPSGPPHVAPGNHEVGLEDVNDPAALRPGRPQPSDLAALARRSERYVTVELGRRIERLYATWSPVSPLHAREYGVQLPNQAAKWRDLLLASSSWQLVYRESGSYLFRMTAPASRAGPFR
jgi:GT2 family glycosyltransferase